MNTCRMYSDGEWEEGDNFVENWEWRYLARENGSLLHKIHRWQCKDRKNDIPFHYLELDTGNGQERSRRIFSFRSNEERTMFLLTYFLR